MQAEPIESEKIIGVVCDIDFDNHMENAVLANSDTIFSDNLLLKEKSHIMFTTNEWLFHTGAQLSTNSVIFPD